ncbi:ATP-dependent DNA helicase [Ramaria rubella]|nr:ATP-dependent DNA helicase [Ramaria rubella]
MTSPSSSASFEKPEQITKISKTSLTCNRVLAEVFGHTAYKGKQREIVEAAIQGADVLVIAPTGLGKSLCFQVPAIADEHGITIVVSPLLALMKNQVDKLRELDVSVVAFTSEISVDDKQQILQELRSGHPNYRLLYLTPEKLCNREFLDVLEKVHSNQELNRLVVDEAHCISEWGHDFRQDYRRLGIFRDRFPDVPVMALTASATAAVQDDILTSLKMSNQTYRAIHPFNRPNLYYEVRYLPNPAPAAQMADIYDYISTLHSRRGRPSSGIVYCRTRATCDELSAYLRSKGLNARPYHKGLKSVTLFKTLEDWQIGGSGEGGVDLVVATIAFGCGIDKSDVRYVIHYDLPKGLEGFYQETGRAGRDGAPSKCILYYSREDAVKVRKLVSLAHKNRQMKAMCGAAPAPTQRTTDSLSALLDFAESTTLCRHVSICKYFGELIEEGNPDAVGEYCRKMCDVCKFPEKVSLRHTRLSGTDFISTQIPRLERSINLEDDDEYTALPSRPPMQRSGLNPQKLESKENLWRGDQVGLPPVKLSVSSFTELGGTSHGSKRPAVYASGNAGKRMKTDGPTVLSGPASSRLTGSLKRQCKTPFKTPFKEDPTAVLRSPATVAPRVHTSGAAGVETSSCTVVPVELDDEEAEMVDSACVAARSSSPELTPDAEIMPDAPYSQKVPLQQRETTLKAIRGALQKVFMQGDKQDVRWNNLKMRTTDIDLRHKVLALTAKELEFTAHAYCSTAEGYKALSYTQISAVKLLKADDTWREHVATGDNEHDDAIAVLTILHRLSSQFRKGQLISES